MARSGHAHCAHLLQATVPRHPALLAVTATLPELCAYSATFAPPDALEELTAYLLSWAASAAPSQPLTADPLRRAAAAAEGAHRAAELLRRRLPADTARVALLEGLCSSLTRHVRTLIVPTWSAVCSSAYSPPCPYAYWSSCLGGYFRCSGPWSPTVQALGKSASGKPAAASLMHTRARLTRRARLLVTPAPLTDPWSQCNLLPVSHLLACGLALV